MAMSAALSRRELLRTALGASMAALACNPRGKRPRPLPDGELLDIGGAHAHRWLREGLNGSAASLSHDFTRAPSRSAQVVIVGAGIAGLSAAWRLARAGVEDIAVVEVDVAPGGTARNGHGAAGAFPWGAHYVVMPGEGFDAFEELLTELGAIERKDADGRPTPAERAACREPAERHFRDGRFYPGLYPLAGETADERAQRERLARLLGELGRRRDDDGLPWFALPQARTSRSEAVLALDRISFAHWLDQHGFSSWRLRWVCEYACRDDYGCALTETSARAGLMYFCARLSAKANAGDLDGGRAVLTWPEGNGRIVAHLLAKSRARMLCERACVRVTDAGDGEVLVDTLGTGGALRLRAPHVVAAVPSFVAARILPSGSHAQSSIAAPSTSPWAVANLHLSRRPNDRGRRFPEPMPWDTVFTASESLGYVAATHQTGRDHGPTVLTWYRPLTDADPVRARRTLSQLSREHWAEAALSELELAHPNIRDVVTRVDVARFGHAMVRPTPGLWAAAGFAERSLPRGRIHVAHTDLAGMALCEEAFHAGVSAADAILRDRRALERGT